MSRRVTGQRAEQYVADALAARAWRILARNLRTPCAELDLLVEDPGRCLVVVEVKARGVHGMLHGEEVLCARQRRRLESALEWLARRQPTSRELRLDLAIVFQTGGHIQGWEHLEGLARIEAAQG